MKFIIFGCGKVGISAYNKLKENHDIIAWADNNKNIWGKEKNDIEIIPPSQIKALQENKDVAVLIAISEYLPVLIQLSELSIENIMVWKVGLLYCIDKYHNVLQFQDIIEKENSYKGILFVQTEACIRTHKIAKAIRNSGYDVYLAYLTTSPTESNSEYANIYKKIFPINSMRSLVNLVNNNEFEYIHCSNEPDILTMLLTKTGKVVIHDCHDLSSAYKKMSPEEMTIEYIANKITSGVIYTSEGIRNQAIQKFQISKERTFVFENLISEELKPQKYLTKLSKVDGKIHCVYEGGIVANDKESHRYFEVIFTKIAMSGVQLHFYTNCDVNYCMYLEDLHPNIHYEGNRTSKELASEMTMYDVGICVLNVTDKNRQYLEFASPNKIQEYINAGLPVAVGDIQSQIDFVEKNNFGRHLDIDSDILEQIKCISMLKIEKDALMKKGLTLESKIPKLIEFCKSKDNRQ